jgi:hypothetical protein
MQQQHEIADAVAAEAHTSRNHALAAAPLAAGVKAKLPLQQQQLDVCDTAAAVAGIADNEQQHTQLLQCLPVAESAAATTVAAVVAGRELSKQPGWLWRVCSRLFSCMADSSPSWEDGVLTVEVAVSWR